MSGRWWDRSQITVDSTSIGLILEEGEARNCRFCQKVVESTKHIIWERQPVGGCGKTFLGRGMDDMEGKVPLCPGETLQFVMRLGLTRDEDQYES